MEERDLQAFLDTLYYEDDSRKEIETMLRKYLCAQPAGVMHKQMFTFQGDHLCIVNNNVLWLWQRIAADAYRSLHSVDCQHLVGMMMDKCLLETVVAELLATKSNGHPSSSSLLSIAKHDWLPVYLFLNRMEKRTHFSATMSALRTTMWIFHQQMSISHPLISEEVFRNLFRSEHPGRFFRDMVVSGKHNNFNGHVGGVLASLFEIFDCIFPCDDQRVCDEIIWFVRDAPDDSSGISLICRSESDRHTFIERKYPRQTRFSKSLLNVDKSQSHHDSVPLHCPEDVSPIDRVYYHNPGVGTKIAPKNACDCGVAHQESCLDAREPDRQCYCRQAHVTGRDVQVALAVKSARQFDYVDRASSVLYKHLLRDIVPSIFEFLHSQ
jgi:hypothetical protein